MAIAWKRGVSLAMLVAVMGGSGCTMLTPISVEYLKQDPPPGSIPQGKVVYVDDGQCPDGQVKKLIGGNAGKNIPRHVECVRRPQ